MQWYLNRSGTAEGPLDEGAVLGMISAGEVPGDAQICPVGGNEWKPLTSHPPFAQAASAAARVKSSPGRVGAPPAAQATPAPTSSPGPASPSQGGVAPTMALDSNAIQQMAQSRGGFPPPGGFGGQPGSAPGFGGHPASQPGSHPASHPGAMAAHAPGPAMGAMGAATPPKKSKLPLLVGGGCGLLLLLTICVGGGIFAATSLGGGGEFADEVNAASEDVLAAAQVRPSDVRGVWNGSGGGGETLANTTASVAQELGQLGSSPEIKLSAVAFRAIAGQRQIRAIAVVFPDGRVRYTNLVAGDWTLGDILTPTAFPRANDSQKALISGLDDLLDAAADDCDDIELARASELDGLPGRLVGDILEHASESDRRQICNEVNTHGRDAFTMQSVLAMTVVVQGSGGRAAGLNTSFEIAPGNPNIAFMGPVRVRLFDE